VSPVAKLTAKQEKFVQGLVSGLSQRKAYIGAGYSTKGKTNNYIDKEASLLSKNRKVSVRYNELMDEYKEKAIWTREKATEKLLWLINMSEVDLEEEGFRLANSSAYLNAIKELNEIALIYPVKDKQIEKIDSEIKKDETAEDKLAEYLKVLGDTIDET